jgi:hypothetical protein
MSYGVPVAEEVFSTRVAMKVPSSRIVVGVAILFLSCVTLSRLSTAVDNFVCNY